MKNVLNVYATPISLGQALDNLTEQRAMQFDLEADAQSIGEAVQYALMNVPPAIVALGDLSVHVQIR